MAITEAYPRVVVEIVVDKVPLQEYVDDDEEKTHNTVTKYIESKSGSEFEIRYTLTAPFPQHDIKFEIYLDGKYVMGRFRMYSRSSYTDSISGITTTVGTNRFLRKFCFSELSIDDSDLNFIGDQLKKALDGVGDIKVEAHFVKNIVRSKRQTFLEENVTHLGTIPEKALKGKSLSHQASLGPMQATMSNEICDCTYIDPEKIPFATFNFRYRSLAALKSLLIIKRSLSPVPLEERNINSLSLDELRARLLQVERERKEAEQTARTVKQEGIKRERSRSRDRSKNAKGERDDGEVTFVEAKRRKTYPSLINENGVETLDLT